MHRLSSLAPISAAVSLGLNARLPMFEASVMQSARSIPSNLMPPNKSQMCFQARISSKHATTSTHTSLLLRSLPLHLLRHLNVHFEELRHAAIKAD